MEKNLGFPGGSVVKNPPANADVSSVPGSGRSPGEGSSNTLQYSCLEHSMDRGAWWATVHGVAKESAMTQKLNNSNTYVCVCMLTAHPLPPYTTISLPDSLYGALSSFLLYHPEMLLLKLSYLCVMSTCSLLFSPH